MSKQIFGGQHDRSYRVQTHRAEAMTVKLVSVLESGCQLTPRQLAEESREYGPTIRPVGLVHLEGFFHLLPPNYIVLALDGALRERLDWSSRFLGRTGARMLNGPWDPCPSYLQYNELLIDQPLLQAAEWPELKNITFWVALASNWCDQDFDDVVGTRRLLGFY